MTDALVQALRSEVAELRTEVQQLRGEVDKLKGGSSGSEATSSAQSKPSKPKPSGNFGGKFHQWNSKSLTNAPQKLPRPYFAVKDGKVYFSAGRTTDSSPAPFMVFCLDLDKDKWITLPQSTQCYGSLAVIQDMVTYIGGREKGTNLVSGNLLSFQGSGEKGEWQECLPPLPTPRFFSCSMIKDNLLLVVGGENFNGRLTTVEILNTDTMEWTEVSPTPEPTCNASLAIIGDTVYVLAGMKAQGHNFSNAAYTCSFSELIKSTPEDDEVWDTLPTVPSDFAVATVMCDTLVAVGGWSPERQDTPVKNLVAYSPQAKKWNNIGFLSKPRSMTSAVQLDDGSKTLIVGGQVSPVRCLDEAEIIEAKN